MATISNDIVGIEYSSVLKNIMAIVSGIYNSMGYGDNFQAVLISNAVKEMNNFINSLHITERNICSSVYLKVCNSELKKNVLSDFQ